MLYRLWAYTITAAVLLAFSPLSESQNVGFNDNLTRLPGPVQDTDSFSRFQGSITGNVHGENNNPIIGARVEIRNLQSGMLAAYGYTNTSGRFELSNLPLGDYDVTATSGLSETHEQVRIDGARAGPPAPALAGKPSSR